MYDRQLETEAVTKALQLPISDEAHKLFMRTWGGVRVRATEFMPIDSSARSSSTADICATAAPIAVAAAAAAAPFSRSSWSSSISNTPSIDPIEASGCSRQPPVQ